jgi:arylsulfatase A-like enzyme
MSSIGIRATIAIVLVTTAAFYTSATGANAETVAPARPAKKPNVLLIIIDDVAANVHSVNQPSPVQTPNIQRLATRSAWFTHAYNDAPACCPSRTAMLTGVASSRSGVYYNTQSYTRSGTWIAKTESLPANFLRNGYLTASYGKLYHSRDQADHFAEFTPGYFKMHNVPRDVSYTDGTLLKQILPNSFNEIPGHTSRNWTWGILPDNWDRDDPAAEQQDTEQANRTIKFLSESNDRPFFLACGFWRPHVPWTVAKRYYDMFPLDKIQLPPGYKAGDLDDLPKPGRWIANHRGEHAEIVAADMWKKSLHGYYASMAYIDEQIGRVLDALDRGPHRDNTIIIFLSDNGMHLGEKDHWLKYALWEQTCQVLLSIHVPGQPHRQIDSPVSLLDLYPTLIDLCRLAPPSTHTLDGIDLAPLLSGKGTERGKPVLSTYGRGNHAIRDGNYRYIHYRNGDEELYDHRHDKYEWTNLANDHAYDTVKKRLAQFLPIQDAPDVPEIGAASDNSRWQDEAFQ